MHVAIRCSEMVMMGWRGYDSSESSTEIVQLMMDGAGM
jgi:hypothetical protein